MQNKQKLGIILPMRMFDCFLFFNEFELLELRLMTLSDVVDYFVLVEANKTHTGNTKDFLFEKQKTRYQTYLNKIIYVQVSDIPELDRTKNMWAIEDFQRNCILRGLTHANEEDRVMISDVDEIPDPAVLCTLKDSSYPVTFRHYLFYYYVNCYSGRGWNGSVITPFKNMPDPSTLRGMARRGVHRIGKAGWHYSYMGGLTNIKQKLANISDAHTRNDRVGTDEDILRKIGTQKDLWDEDRQHQLIDIDSPGMAPLCIRQFIQKYPNFFFGSL